MAMKQSRSDETRCAITTLTGFRSGLHQCWTSWADAAFELTDTVLCMPSPVGSVPALSLEPVFRRSHGSLYKALARGGVDDEAMRELLVEHRPSGWPLVFAVDASTWPRCDAETSPETGLLLLGVQALRRTADRSRLVLPVDHATGLGGRLLDRADGRTTYPGRQRHHHRDRRPGQRPDPAATPWSNPRPAARQRPHRGRGPHVRLRRRLRPDRADPRTRRSRRDDRGPHPR